VKIATFNINGVQRRLRHLLAWLAAATPDVACLQELKVEPARFPHSALQEAGYGAAWVAEGAYNGVAILTRRAEPIVTRRALPGGDDDTQCRYLEAAVNGVLIACVYAPNGNPQPGPRFDYKLRWMERLHAHAQVLQEADVPVILAGDFNVVPTDRDMYPSKSSWKHDALVQPAPRAAYQRLLALGYRDALRARHPEPSPADYTFWDYKRDGWRRGHGLRIDHLLLSRAIGGRLLEAGVRPGHPGSRRRERSRAGVDHAARSIPHG
jgi:exodeoxyribonuclease-3